MVHVVHEQTSHKIGNITLLKIHIYHNICQKLVLTISVGHFLCAPIEETKGHQPSAGAWNKPVVGGQYFYHNEKKLRTLKFIESCLCTFCVTLKYIKSKKSNALGLSSLQWFKPWSRVEPTKGGQEMVLTELCFKLFLVFAFYIKFSLQTSQWSERNEDFLKLKSNLLRGSKDVSIKGQTLRVLYLEEKGYLQIDSNATCSQR